MHRDICQTDCIFSSIRIANATSKLYRTNSYLFLSPCTATQEAEREQEECQLVKELKGKESRNSIYLIRVLRLCSRWPRGSYPFDVIRKICVYGQDLWSLKKLSSILLVFRLSQLPDEFKQDTTVILEVNSTLQFFLAFHPQHFLFSVITVNFYICTLERLQREIVTVQQQISAKDTEKEFRWTVNVINSDNIPVVPAYTGKARPRRTSFVKAFLLSSWL